MRNFTICTWTQPLWQVLFWNLDLSIWVAFGNQTLRRIATINPLEEIMLPLFHKFGVFRYKTTIKKNLTEKRCLNSSSLRDGLWLFFMQIPHCLFFCLVGFFHISRLCKTEYKPSFNLRHGWWNSPLAARRTFPSWESQFECAVLKHNECHN